MAREGIPYTIGEARALLADRGHRIDEYHRELIRFLVGELEKKDSLRPMSEAPTTGPVVEILAATSDRAGCKGWLIVHYADGGGEEQPRFRGWFYWTGYEFRQIETSKLLGWRPLPEVT